MNADSDTVNATYWEEGATQAQSHIGANEKHNRATEKSRPRGMIFYFTDINR